MSLLLYRSVTLGPPNGLEDEISFFGAKGLFSGAFGVRFRKGVTRGMVVMNNISKPLNPAQDGLSAMNGGGNKCPFLHEHISRPCVG